MSILASIVRAIGYIWIGLVAAFGIYSGFMSAFFHAPGLVTQSGFGDIWFLTLVASPGVGLVWLSNRIATKPEPQKSSSGRQA